jgi:predicted phage terminase large subunit-like protein
MGAFPDVKIQQDSHAAKRFHTSKGGVYYAVGAGGPITSRGGDLIVIDDIIKNRQEAESKAHRDKLKDWYASTLYTRLMPNGAIVIINTRWSTDDICGWLLTKEEKWDVISFPSVSEDDTALWPEKYSRERLTAIKSAIGSREFESLYQQNPTPPEGNLFKRKWWKFYKEPPARFDEVILSCDAAFKDTDQSDFVVIQCWGRSGGEFYLLDQVRNRMNFPTTVQAYKLMAYKHPRAVGKLIEAAANGDAIIATLQKELPGIIGVRPTGSKTARASAISPCIEAGNVYLPEHEPWVSDFLVECDSFPAGKNDDQVDAMVHALARLMKSVKLGPIDLDLGSMTKTSTWSI